MIPSNHKREFFGLLFAIILIATAVIWIRIKTVKATYQFVQREKEALQIQNDIQTLRLSWGQLTSPKRLMELAGRMGLQAPTRQQVLQYGDH